MPPSLPKKTALPALIVATAMGCSSAMRVPNLLHPGPTGPQQLDAIYFDPYPLDDVAPEIVGGRPREYQRPVPEVSRSRLESPQRATIAPGPLPQQPLQPFLLQQPAATVPAF